MLEEQPVLRPEPVPELEPEQLLPFEGVLPECPNTTFTCVLGENP